VVRHRFSVNVAWTLGGNVLYAAGQWVLVVLLARWTNPEAVGGFALALAVAAPVSLMFNMQLRAVIAADVAGRRPFVDYFQARLVSAAAAVAVAGMLALLTRDSASTRAVIVLVALSKAAESLSDIVQGQWQRMEDMRLVGKSLAVRAACVPVLFASAVILTRTIVWGAVFLLAGSIGVFLLYDYPAVRRAIEAAGERSGLFRLEFRRIAIIRPLIRMSAPLGVVAMLISLNASIPRYFIDAYRGKHDLGVFSALAYFIVVGNLLVNSVGQSAIPRLAKLYRPAALREFLRALFRLMALSLGLGVLSLLISIRFGRVLLAIYGDDYAAAYQVFVLIMAAAAIGYLISVLNYTLNVIQAYAIQVPLFLGISILLAVVCPVVVPAYGIGGAAAALLATGVVQMIASAAVIACRIRKDRIQTLCS